MTQTEWRVAAIGGGGITPATLRAVLDSLSVANLAPERWGTQDGVVRLPFDAREVLGCWEAGGRTLYLERDRAPVSELCVRSAPAPFCRLHLDRADAQHIPALFAAAHAWAASGRFDLVTCGAPLDPATSPVSSALDANAFRRAASTLRHVIGTAPSTYRGVGPAGLALRTYFGPRYADQFGHDFLLRTPGVLATGLSGGVLIDLAERPWLLGTDQIVERWLTAMGHLETKEIFAVPDDRFRTWRKGPKCTL